jgi:hypothetical protein
MNGAENGRKGNPMAIMASDVAVEFDAAAQTLLTEVDGVTHAGSDEDWGQAVALPRYDSITGARWNPLAGEIPGSALWVNVHVTALAGEADTYDLQLQGNEHENFGSGNPHTLATIQLISGMPLGLYRFAVDTKTIQKLKSNTSFVRLGTVKSGDGPPSVTFRAWLSQR